MAIIFGSGSEPLMAIDCTIYQSSKHEARNRDFSCEKKEYFLRKYTKIRYKNPETVFHNL